ncbi:beta-ketoacyl synthase N-terminal-like domain-containing protein [Chitinophaga nivalis]|uniref:Polyketide synthase dehydratase domain-containing protein n=1 Tax=Chitinophaga nivalis TaxID=2991709 RepID=A0ABT3IMV7_9BACT|nr:beta-ketoacyl synthase N-terminal-like domain-containing protein [Chitinophaga nivalis]MCW3464994.1 polyketide synthase dehydratase domain-containing protein [Chitinophaga nivalis]MCW3485314.1 polyketide synthase dehydratase domain-containing protein [Chitinophaga nivalis]
MAIHFWEYVFNELKDKRLQKSDAKDLIRQFYYHQHGSGFEVPYLHPLLHTNSSTLQEQRFTSLFNGEEFFLRDHVMNGRRILPAVAYLEMARTAIALGNELPADEVAAIGLKNVIWPQPLIVGEDPVKVHVGLYEQGTDINYEIYTHDKEGVELLHGHGTGYLITAIATPPVYDIAAVQARCTNAHLTSELCYTAFDRIGLTYGPGHRCIEDLWLGEGEVLARLALPAITNDTGYVLHPGLVDSALQSCIGLFWNGAADTPGNLLIPFNMDKVLLYGSTAPGGIYWSSVRCSEGSSTDATTPRLDIDIVDDTGKVLISIRGFGIRALGNQKKEIPVSAATGVFLYEPVLSEDTTTYIPEEERIVFLCELPEDLQTAVATTIGNARCISLQATGDMDVRYHTYSEQLYTCLQELLTAPPPGGVVLQLVTGDSPASRMFQGLGALLRTATMERLKIRSQQIRVPNTIDGAQLLEILAADMATADREISYADGIRYKGSWQQIAAADDPVLPWKAGGIYVITGGSGKLGQLFTTEILQQVPDAHVIITGLREQVDMDVAGVDYQICNIKEKTEVDALFDWIEDTYGRVDGIIHAAGILRDALITNKEMAEAALVMAPKVSGLLHLDERTAQYELDFFVCFSSVIGAFGNAGQGDYALGNSFMDHYALYRNELVAAGVRSGHTLSINWPLWEEGGMHVDAASLSLVRQTYGVTLLSGADGLHSFYRALHTRLPRVLVLSGEPLKLQRLLNEVNTTSQPEKIVKPDVVSTTTALSADSLKDHVRRLLLQDISRLLSIDIDQLDIDNPLNEYGFDSVQLTRFSSELSTNYDIILMPALFFEYPTINAFTGYLCDTYGDTFAAKLQMKINKPATQTIAIPSSATPRTASPQRRSRHHQRNGSVPAPTSAVATNIAVIGMSGCFPQAADIVSYWQNLVEGRNCISEVPPDRWDWSAVSRQTVEHGCMQWGGFIESIASFDPLFFNISPKEAISMDPQQRLLMEYVWKVIEDGGYSTTQLAGSNTGLFIGTACGEYLQLLSQSNMEIEGFSTTGVVSSVGPNRMSYFLDLHGPSEPVETACSSSLVAIHRAVEYIQQGHGEMAIAGGINTLVSPAAYISFAKAGMLSPDGRCKTFSAAADGYVRGEGVGMLLLKELKAAERDGDHIYGVIRGTAENHGGHASSLTAPSTKAQAALLQKAYQRAGIAPWTVGYIEAHGTGTRLGDPVEISALKAAFKALCETAGGTPEKLKKGNCGIGSVKSNIGHLELAAGVAGIIKVLLQLQHQTLVKSLHSETLNPYLELEESPFYVVQETRPWEALYDDNGIELPRRAGVSSFGFGGVNAHVVLEEYKAPVKENSYVPGTALLIVLSARNNNRLQEVAVGLQKALQSGRYQETDLASIAYTLQVGREGMEERLAFIVTGMEELLQVLDVFIRGSKDAAIPLYRGQVKGNREALSVFADEDMQQGVLIWIEKGKYNKLLDAWVKGYPVDWNLLYKAANPGRISLPTYPFVKERYWIEGVRFPARNNKIAMTTAAEFDECFYDELMDEVISGTTTIDTAVCKMRQRN